ncbi:PA14 domain-containing protein [Pontibacter russatus]|uniref:PA14 domain-containing protein n=1 Tax=Pontibacter russatus TaxID=2694929 RepID=UPI00137ACBAC|nr:PA14 domain-containing protein [Pontibacter russatus]
MSALLLALVTIAPLYTTSGSAQHYSKPAAISGAGTSVDNNTVAPAYWGYINNKHAVSAAGRTYFRSYAFLPNLVIRQMKQDGFITWSEKLQQLGIVPGPIVGDGSAAPANQAPTVSITSPKATASSTENMVVAVSVAAQDADGAVAKVELFRDGTKVGTEFEYPYEFRLSNLAPGTYSLTAKATDKQGGATISAAISVTVTKAAPALEPASAAPAPSGKITREFWAGVTGSGVLDIPVAAAPTQTGELTSFEAPTNMGDHYGQRIRGFVTAPQSGEYTFWLASDDAGELWLSPSDDATKKVKIASVKGYTSIRQWDKYASQRSARVRLEVGKRYYIEALHLEAAGSDHLAVGWQLPSGELERPIAGNRLSPIGSIANVNPVPVYITGKISREFWGGVAGSTVQDIPVAKAPSNTSELTFFEAPSNAGDHYGQRIRGFVTAPHSGEYTFWLASDDAGELWLSPSDDATKKVKIASVKGYTSIRQWDKYASQRSARVRLEAGKRYYIEALHLEAAGSDHLAVGWQLPSGALERPIAGSRLSPYSHAPSISSSMQVASATQKEPFLSEVTAYPNPFSEVITLYMGSQEAELKEVVLLDQSGRVLYKHEDLTLDNSRLSIKLSGSGLARGLYFLRYTDAQGSSRSLKVIKQ